MTEIHATLSSFILDYDLYYHESNERETKLHFVVEAEDEMHAINQLLNFYEQDESCSVSCVQQVRLGSPYESNKMMTVSTAHIDLEASAWLANDAKANSDYCHTSPQVDARPGILNSMEGAYSWVIQVPSEIDAIKPLAVPSSIKNLLQFAHQKGYQFVQLDQDGPFCADLPSWDW